MTRKKDILGAISPAEALAVLNELTKDPQIRKRAEAIALAVVREIAIEAIAKGNIPC